LVEKFRLTCTITYKTSSNLFPKF